MLRPSGETSGSATHCRSKTSSGLNAGFGVCAITGAAKQHSSRAAARRLFLTGNPATTLMFIHNPHSLHEGIANSCSNKLESLFFEVFAHCIAVRRRWSDVAEMER